MSAFDKGDLLNEYQRRSLSVALRSLEDALHNMELLFKKGDYHGVLYDMENDVPVAVKNEMMGKISSIKGKINTLAARFSLDRRHRKARQLILSQLSCAWESLEETKTKRLKRYGDVDQELKELLDAELDTIIRMVLEMERLLWDDAQ